MITPAGVTLPTKVSALGGHVMFNDDQQTPNVLMAMFEFPNPAAGGDQKKLLEFEVRKLKHDLWGRKSERFVPGEDRQEKFFEDLQATYPCIGEVRGKGLMLAIECVNPGTKEPNAAASKAFIAECSKQRLILMGAGVYGNCVRFLPPLNIPDADIDVAMGIFTAAAKVAFV